MFARGNENFCAPSANRTRDLPNTRSDVLTTEPPARFSKDPVTTGPENLLGRLTGDLTGREIAFLEAPVNFPGTYRAR